MLLEERRDIAQTGAPNPATSVAPISGKHVKSLRFRMEANLLD
jgi:hypothetical protein